MHNRISRFTANGDVAVAGSETVILELDNLSGATNHNGGALAFGPDGKLYAAVGENANGANAQTLGNLLGKMLRLNKDGTIPTDNPFFTSATGRNRAIWALGLRNPFTFAFNRAGAELFINDVGQNTWEEINDGIAGANYGWPDTEGATTDPSSGARGIHTTTPRGAVRDHRRRVLLAADAADSRPSTRRTTFSPTTAAAGFDGWTSRRGAWRPSRPGSRHRSISRSSDDGALYYLARGAGARLSRRLRHERADHHDASGEPDGPIRRAGHLQRQGVGHAAAALSMDAQRRRHRRAPRRRTTPSPPSLRRTTARGSARLVTNDFGNVLSDEAVLTVVVEPGADRDDHAAGGRHAVQRGNGRQLRGDGDRS